MAFHYASSSRLSEALEYRPQRAVNGECSRRPTMEMVGEHVLLFIFGLPSTFRWCFQAAGGKGALEGFCSGKGQALLLACTT